MQYIEFKHVEPAGWVSEGPVAHPEGTYLSRLTSLSQLTSNLQAVDSCRRELDCNLCAVF